MLLHDFPENLNVFSGKLKCMNTVTNCNMRQRSSFHELMHSMQEIDGVRYIRAPEFFWPLVNKSDGTESDLGRVLADKIKGQSRQLDRILFGGITAEDWVTMGVGHLQVR